MDLDFRPIIFYNFRRRLTQQQRIDELNSIFDDKALSRISVYRRYGEFNRFHSSIQDEFRKGRLKSVAVPGTIDAVRQLILKDRHVTYREFDTILDISGTSIHSILHEHLTVKKICFRWIPHNLSIAQENQSIKVTKLLRQLVQTPSLFPINFEKQ